MGNNAAFSSFEASVLAVYDAGVLTRELLDALAAPYNDTDIDRGGMSGTLAKDGLDIDGIILKMYEVAMPERPKLPKNYMKWTDEQQSINDCWNDQVYDKLQAIEEGWGW